MGETIGDVMRRVFGLYDYVAISDTRRTSIHSWNKVPSAAEGRKFRSYELVNGMELCKKLAVPSDLLSEVYLVFEV